tara:strand:- start:47 stop:304 length:258 start_codon:yes stop_codon:yes gene_type:complete
MTWKEEIKKAPLKDFQRRMARHKDGLMPEATPPASKITLDEALAEIKARREPNPKHIEVLEELIELFDKYHEIDSEPTDSEGYPY